MSDEPTEPEPPLDQLGTRGDSHPSKFPYDEPTHLPDAYASQDYQKGWREGRASAEARIAELEAENIAAGNRWDEEVSMLTDRIAELEAKVREWENAAIEGLVEPLGGTNE